MILVVFIVEPVYPRDMIKRTLLFSKPAYLSTRNKQLLVSYPDKNKKERTVPIEDIGLLLLENKQITCTHALLDKLLDNKAAIVTCNEKHMPNGLLQPLLGHSEQTERYRIQFKMSKPLKKNLWKQIIVRKIQNQATLLRTIGEDASPLIRMVENVVSGDTTNQEAIAAAYYWKHLFSEEIYFQRDRYGAYPNNFLNYGYAILRAMVARAIISSGLLPTIGIHHKSKYNPYCLADDIMEPYRIYVDEIVVKLINDEVTGSKITPKLKKMLLQIPVIDVNINGKTRPLMNALSLTTASLYRCICGEKRNLKLPLYEPIENIK